MSYLDESMKILNTSDPLSSSSSSSVECSIKSSSNTSNQRGTRKLQELRAVVETAIQNHKTFTVLGPFTCIKHALKLRGWIEKFEDFACKQQQDDLKLEKSSAVIGQEINDTSERIKGCDSTLDDIQMSRLLRDYGVDFVWTMKNEPIKWKRLNSRTLISRFARADFTTKAGLCNSLQQPHWHYEDGVSMILFPRCYNTTTEDEMSAFIENFRLTACVSLIRLVCENSISEENVIFQKDGKIPISSVEFALKRCQEYIAEQQHFDIDKQSQEKIWAHQWDQFLTCYYMLVHDDETFASENSEEATVIQKQCQEVLTQLAVYWTQLHLDGTNNLWILKPAAKSRGRGIHIMKKLENILAKMNSQQGKECRYVAQKYIERPLLVYDTKFDIRQWFLITSAYPLTVWMYKESYLRFCSQAFSLFNTHESVHLSNNAVQCKYTNGVRDRNLPDENMWDCYTFQTYLRSKGNSDVWDSIIYPGMRKNIIGTLLASQHTLDNRKGCFELFGADFMLSETFEPWLIEINSGPSMSASTSVTARMCAQVLDDVIKVVIDRKYDKNADVGMFELAYKQVIPPVQPYMGQNLVVRGAKMEDMSGRRTAPCKPRKRKLSNTVSLRLSQPKKQPYIRHCRSEDRIRTPKVVQKTARPARKEKCDNSSQQQKENVLLRLIERQKELNGCVNKGDIIGVLGSAKKVADVDTTTRKKHQTADEKCVSEQGGAANHSLQPLPIVGETAKYNSSTLSSDAGARTPLAGRGILPPIIQIQSRLFA